MEYISYVNYLKSKNIILFDHDYRLSYHNITNISNNDNNMTGGGLNKLVKYSDYELNMIINIAISNNPRYLLYL
jgi:hypothetical protein